MWCGTQRSRYKEGKLDSEKVNLLEKIDFPWEKLDTWSKNYELLKEYREKFSEQWPKAKETFMDVNLGGWCTSQRTKFKKNKLDDDKIQLLNEIEFVWFFRKK